MVFYISSIQKIQLINMMLSQMDCRILWSSITAERIDRSLFTRKYQRRDKFESNLSVWVWSIVASHKQIRKKMLNVLSLGHLRNAVELKIVQKMNDLFISKVMKVFFSYKNKTSVARHGILYNTSFSVIYEHILNLYCLE